MKNVLGSVVASVVTGALTAGVAFAEGGAKPAGGEAKGAYCQNNQCKGHSACAGHGNASCAGQNTCKGKGFLKAKDKAECEKDAKGVWKEEAKK
jgi:hypothetical protein